MNTYTVSVHVLVCQAGSLHLNMTFKMMTVQTTKPILAALHTADH